MNSGFPEGLDQQIFLQVSDLIDDAVKPRFWQLVRENPSVPPPLMLASVGKAVLMMGANLIGNSAELSADQAIGIGKRCLEKFQKAIDEKRRGADAQKD
jgi:hypothetical protein